MSAGSFPVQPFWPAAIAGGGPVGASVRHIVDLAQFFPAAGPAWPDALTAETRRHLAGCLNASERSLRAMLASGPVHRALATLEGPLVWPAVQAQPQILSAALIAHMRLRGAVSLLSRQGMGAGGDPLAPADDMSGWPVEDDDPRISGAALLLGQAEAGWVSVGEDIPMQPDLPAEYFAELLWAATATLWHALAPMMTRSGIALDAVSAAAAALLASHREEDGAIARAGILARLLRGRADVDGLFGQSIGQRRLLFFAALAADRTGIEIEAALATLVESPVGRLAALCRIVHVTPTDFRQLLIDLKIVRSGLDDGEIVALAEDYDMLTADAAESALAVLRQPQAFRAKLALIAAPAS